MWARLLRYYLTELPLAYFWYYILCCRGIHRWYVAMYVYEHPSVEYCRYCYARRSGEPLSRFGGGSWLVEKHGYPEAKKRYEKWKKAR